MVWSASAPTNREKQTGFSVFKLEEIIKYYYLLYFSFSFEDIESSSIDSTSTDFTSKSLFNFSLGNSLDTEDIDDKKNVKKKRELEVEIERDHELAALIDRQARILFPLSWIIFMLLYFFYLAEVHKEIQPINIALSN